MRVDDLLVLVHMAGLLVAAAVAKRIAPLPRLVRLFDARPGGAERRGAGEPTEDEVRRLIRLARGLLRRTHGQGFCMEQALILFRLLRRRGCPVRIHFGAAKRLGGLSGHAWLTLRGRALAEASDPRAVYAATFTYPPTNH